jgi:FkbM family methyltransferase
MKTNTFSTFFPSLECLLEETPQGIWVVKNESPLSDWVRQSGRLDHDQTLIPKACQYISPHSVVIDVGANIGDHTIAYCRATGPEGIVIAYEPHPLACECLRRNCPEALAFQCAVGATIGQTPFSPEPCNVGASFLSEEATMMVNITTLDSDFSKILSPLGWKKVSLIKIDAEGAEPEVLQGAEQLITQYRPVLVLEINMPALARRGHNDGEIRAFMEKHGYRIELIPPDFGWSLPQFDILCLPN